MASTGPKIGAVLCWALLCSIIGLAEGIVAGVIVSGLAAIIWALVAACQASSAVFTGCGSFCGVFCCMAGFCGAPGGGVGGTGTGCIMGLISGYNVQRLKSADSKVLVGLMVVGAIVGAVVMIPVYFTLIVAYGGAESLGAEYSNDHLPFLIGFVVCGLFFGALIGSTIWYVIKKGLCFPCLKQVGLADELPQPTVVIHMHAQGQDQWAGGPGHAQGQGQWAGGPGHAQGQGQWAGGPAQQGNWSEGPRYVDQPPKYEEKPPRTDSLVIARM